MSRGSRWTLRSDPFELCLMFRWRPCRGEARPTSRPRKRRDSAGEAQYAGIAIPRLSARTDRRAVRAYLADTQMAHSL